MHDSLRNKSSARLEYIELRTRPNQLEMFVSSFIHENNIEKYLFQKEKDVVLNEKKRWDKTM